ncbi:VOC family protein [Paenibacillus eucommiae]|uniref:PhnB protein n=1 Tax=Paenibacillus eucommiae TaxID=1355755 RepID=A0ABS4J9P8_9BACL|nr:VOC family protein [Paenibacillus eucommiae]MBP1995444.1 PhnB protein [Paenibacillus eucommiae]
MSLQLNCFIMLDGHAEEAIEFYEKSLGAKILFKQTLGEGPENPDNPLSADEKKRIAHSVLHVGETEIMVSDTAPGQPLQRGNQVNICITTSDTEVSKQIYTALQQDGQIDLPLEATYFSPAYGMITDKFGVTFQIFTKRPQ